MILSISAMFACLTKEGNTQVESDKNIFSEERKIEADRLKPDVSLPILMVPSNRTMETTTAPVGNTDRYLCQAYR